MTVHYEDEFVTILHGDCITEMRTLPDASIDAIVTDPPYGLGFMGKAWDDLPPGVDFAREALRVLKPGGHLLAFGGTRTWHRLAVAIEDAGFEIRDSIAWLYGSGFPKSMDVSKAIDKGSGENRARQLEFTAWMRATGITAAQINAATGTNMGGHYLTDASQPAIATADLFDKLRPLLPEVPERIERLVAERTGVEWTDYVKREVLEVRHAADRRRDGTVYGLGHSGAADVTAAHSDAARQWDGWGTALKPAFEPIVVARKPLAGTVAANVLAYGTGALNIDGCRIGTTGGSTQPSGMDRLNAANAAHGYRPGSYAKGTPEAPAPAGRWPTNVVLDPTAAADLDEQSGVTRSRIGKPRGAASGDGWGMTKTGAEYDDEGGASRFFPVFRFEAKAPTSERPVVNGVAHPTVKPLALMRWLCRLVTPPGGRILEPFAGSGTTVEAALAEGFTVTAIERDADYLPLIEARLQKGIQPAMDIFGGAA